MKKKVELRHIILGAIFTGISIILTRFFSQMIPLAGIPALRFGFGMIPIVLSGIICGPYVGGMVGVVADLIGFFINPMGGAYFPGFTLSSALGGIIPGLIFLVIRREELNLWIRRIVLIIPGLLIVNGLWAYSLGKFGVIEIKSGKINFLVESMPSWITIAYVCTTIIAIAVPIILLSNSNKRNDYSFSNTLFVVSITYFITSIVLNTLWLSIMSGTPFLVFLPGRLIGNAVSIPLDAVIIYTISRYIKHIK